ncbi:MAG: LPS biosynthesis choline kinase [Propionibacteriales bacterium]|nr:LPS biosynthesis choline kinase [Propionibacteriales bacterium]
MGTTEGVDRLAILAGRSWSVTDLPGGLTNVNVRVTTDDDLEPPLDVVVRCSHGDADLLGIDREAEHRNTVAAAQAGVGAPVLEFRPDLRMLVIGFLPGRALADEDFTDPDVLVRSARAVRRLHGGPRFAGEFDMFARQAAYLATIREHGFRLPADYESYAGAWADVRSALAAVPRASVPCNNDLLAANFIDDGDRVWLIDYEYSGNNDASFELGNTVAECGFTPEMTDAWAEAYFGAPTRADLARVRLQSLCSSYGWSLWGFIQAAASPLDFDFWSWGVERYEKARQTFADPALPRLMEEAARG